MCPLGGDVGTGEIGASAGFKLVGREGEGRRGECDEREGDVGQHRVGAVVAGLRDGERKKVS